MKPRNTKSIVKKLTFIVMLLLLNDVNNLYAEDNLTKTKNDSLPLLYIENFQDGTADNWKPNNHQNWSVEKEGDRYIYQLNKAGESGEIRKPTSISILKKYDVGNFEFIVDAKCYTDSNNCYRDLCLFYGYQDSVHFYYTHFSAISDNVHNIIGIVNNADRKKINNEASGASSAKLTDYNWHQLKISRNIDTGEIKAFIDDFNTPVLTASDTTFKSGKIGVGSFDDTGAFTELMLWGNVVKPNKLKSYRSNESQTFMLSQNFPNPFNSTTHIEFNIQKSQYASLKIYNLKGQEITSLISATLLAGKHNISWDASEMSSGLYFYMLSTDCQYKVKQMILLK